MSGEMKGKETEAVNLDGMGTRLVRIDGALGVILASRIDGKPHFQAMAVIHQRGGLVLHGVPGGFEFEPFRISHPRTGYRVCDVWGDDPKWLERLASLFDWDACRTVEEVTTAATPHLSEIRAVITELNHPDNISDDSREEMDS